MPDGSGKVALSAAEKAALVSKMFAPPNHFLSREVFLAAYDVERAKDAQTARKTAETAFREFVTDAATCPQAVIDFCTRTLAKNPLSQY